MVLAVPGSFPSGVEVKFAVEYFLFSGILELER
jgi:hypothetical protein